MIDFACPHCGNEMHFKYEAAGLTGKCKKCGQTVQVPAALPLDALLHDPFFDQFEEPPPLPHARPSGPEAAGSPATLKESAALLMGSLPRNERIALGWGGIGLALLALSASSVTIASFRPGCDPTT